jgi:hypothetical protein
MSDNLVNVCGIMVTAVSGGGTPSLAFVTDHEVTYLMAKDVDQLVMALSAWLDARGRFPAPSAEVAELAKRVAVLEAERFGSGRIEAKHTGRVPCSTCDGVSPEWDGHDVTCPARTRGREGGQL